MSLQSSPDSVDTTLQDKLLHLQTLESTTNIDSAITAINTSIAAFQAAENVAGTAIGFKVLGELFFRKKDYNKSLESFNQALNGLDKKEYAKAYIESLHKKSFILHQQSDYSSSLKNAKKAMNNCEGDCFGHKGDFLKLSFLASKKLEKLKDAKRYADEAIEHYELHENLTGKASIYLNLAEMYTKVELYEKAFDYYNLSLANYEAVNNTQKVGELKHKIGEYLVTSKDYQNALEKLEEARKYAKEIDNPLLEARVLSDEAKAHYILDDHKASIKALKKSTKIWEKQNKQERLATDLIVLALSYAANDNPKRAIKTFEECITLSNSLKNKNNIFKARTAIAKVQLDQNDLKTASASADKALEILSDITSLESIMETYELVSEIYEVQRKEEAAKDYAVKSQVVADSLQVLETQRQARLAMLRSQLAEVTEELKQVKSDYVEQKAVVQQQKAEIDTKIQIIEDTEALARQKEFYLKVLEAGMILLLLTLAALIYSLFQNRNKNKKRSYLLPIVRLGYKI